MSSMKKNSFTFLLMVIQYAGIQANLLNNITNKLKEENDTILSRKRRYLVFPEGSSFQVVFDLTYPSVAIQGNVFVFGHTAALAWELPSTPIFLDIKKMKKEKENNAEPTTTPTITTEHNFAYITNEHTYPDWRPPLAWDYFEAPSGWPNIDKTYYKNPFEANRDPYFLHAKERRIIRRVVQPDSAKRFSPDGDGPINRTVAHHIQRKSRRKLYSKIEKLLSALSKDGKTCVLKAICQVSQLPQKKGTLWEEIVKAIFRAKHDMYPDEDHYDRAVNKQHDCEKMYPNCDGHVLSNLFRNKMNK